LTIVSRSTTTDRIRKQRLIDVVEPQRNSITVDVPFVMDAMRYGERVE